MSFRFFKQYLVEIILFTIFFAFSIWLMFGTFSYHNGRMGISTKAWSDFANHIPLIRTFSFGSNFPPQDPLFAGAAIHYHFLFYQLVGLLEKIGVRIDYALNIPSTIGFFALLVMIYVFAKKIFKSRIVAIVSVLFFLFNGTLSFLEFFKLHPPSRNTVIDIITNTKFPSFGPYDQKIVSAFWNLNIYTNQRHLAAAYALSLFLIYLLLFYCYSKRETILPSTLREEPSGSDSNESTGRIGWVTAWKEKQIAIVKHTNWKLSIILGLILGLSFFFHLAVFLMTVIVICFLFLCFKELRYSSLIILFIAAIMAFPQYLYLRSGGNGFGLRFVPGYLVSDHLTISNFFIYWFYNFGLHLILIPIGFILADKTGKKMFIAFFALFVIGSLFQFAPEMAENHKFFNYFLLFGNMLSAYVLFRVWRKSALTLPFIIIITFFLLLSGIIDFFPIYNDTQIALDDYPVNKDIVWDMQHTSSQAVFLNTSYLYDTANLAGRKIFLGWPYFPWSSGFDTTTRGMIMKNMLTETNKVAACNQLQENHIDYLELKRNAPFDPNIATPSSLYFTRFVSSYENPVTNYIIIDIAKNCSYNP